MIVATACSHTPTLDHEGKPAPFSNSQLAVKWLDWCAALGGIEDTELLILGPGDFRMPESAKAWRKRSFLRDRTNTKGWPYGPNAAFSQLAWHMHYRKDGDEPWLFCEPDCIPLHATWLAELADAYVSAGKPFMGALIPGAATYPEHMSGNAIYPAKAIRLAPSLVSEKKMNVAWDIRSAHQVVPQMAETNLIFQLYRNPPFRSLEEFKFKVPSSAVLFHSDKYGAVANLLSSPPPSVATAETPAAAPQAAAPEKPPAPELEPSGGEPGRVPVFSSSQLCEVISANVTSETARSKLMKYLHANHFHQKNFGAAIQEAALNGQ
jgi:hypothetical protein